MNMAMIAYILCDVLMIEGIFLLFPTLAALFYREPVGINYLIVAACCILIGIAAQFFKPKKRMHDFFAREGLVTVALAWVVLGLVGALPFYLTGEYPSYVDCVFETVSGFTTSGAGVLSSIEHLSNCNLLWRAITHWIGGMGVLAFLMMILPMTGAQNIHLMRAESPGPTTDKLVPKVRQTAAILYGIYTGITITETVALMISGLTFFEAIILSCSTVGTGGFALLNSSIGGYSLASQIIIIVFMLVCSVNFYVYYLILKGKFKEAFAYEEMRVFFLIVGVSVLLITINIIPYFDSVYEAFHNATFAVATIISTTGFTISNFDVWPQFSKCLIVLLMITGACAGSTGGGVKVPRVIILVRFAKNQIRSLTHPRSVRKVQLNGSIVPDNVVKGVMGYFAAYAVIVLVSYAIVCLDNFDGTTSITAVLTTLANVGPGLGMISPIGSFSEFSDLSKIVFIFDMLAGRLEIFPMLVLLAPSTWKKA